MRPSRMLRNTLLVVAAFSMLAAAPSAGVYRLMPRGGVDLPRA